MKAISERALDKKKFEAQLHDKEFKIPGQEALEAPQEQEPASSKEFDQKKIEEHIAQRQREKLQERGHV